MQESEEKNTVVITHIESYLGAQIAYQCLQCGYKVIGIVDNLHNGAKIQPLRTLHPLCDSDLVLIESDLKHESEASAFLNRGESIIHLLRNYEGEEGQSKKEYFNSQMARTLNVLKAASISPTIQRVVVTSTAALFVEGKSLSSKKLNKLDESEYGNLDEFNLDLLCKLKATLAVNQFYEKESRSFDMTVLYPSLLFGPPRVNVLRSQSLLLTAFFADFFPELPILEVPAIDVRDAAKLHIQALENISTLKGKRVILNNRSVSLLEIGIALSQEFEEAGYIIPNTEMKSWKFSWYSIFQDKYQILKPFHKKKINLHNSPQNDLLKLEHYTPLRQSILEMAYGLMQIGYITNRINRGGCE